MSEMPTPEAYEKAMTEALRKDRARAERDKAVNAFVSLIVLVVVVWFLFGQPTLEDMQTLNLGELAQGWIFP
jgi:type II secretory pathway component PulM